MKKIGFCDRYGLTNAVLDTRKTMTRRTCMERSTNSPILSCEVDSYRFYPDENIVEFLLKDGRIKVSVPRYKINEVVAVAQSYKSIHTEMTNGAFGDSKYDAYRCSMVVGTEGWSNKLFVKPSLMPHQIQITDVNIERLQDISEEDCMKEGIEEDFAEGSPLYFISVPPNSISWDEYRRRVKEISRHFKGDPYDYFFDNPRDAFATLINRPEVGSKGLWEQNPFVVAYQFKLIN